MNNKIEKLFSFLTLWEEKKVEIEKIRDNFKNFNGRIVVISDIHIPFVDVEVFDYFLEFLKKNKDIKTIIIDGDFLNFDIFSRYLKLDGVVSANKEIDIARRYLEKLIDLEKNIIYIKANHELRLEKFLIRSLGNSIANDLLDLGLSLENFFRYKNLKIVNNWFVVIGDCVIAHPEAQSMIRGRVVDWTIEYFETRIKNFRCVVIGHTHKQSKLFRKGRLGLEIGSMCKTLDYTVDSKFTAYRKETQYKGFGILTFDKGMIDFNNTNFVFVKYEDYLL